MGLGSAVVRCTCWLLVRNGQENASYYRVYGLGLLFSRQAELQLYEGLGDGARKGGMDKKIELRHDLGFKS